MQAKARTQATAAHTTSAVDRQPQRISTWQQARLHSLTKTTVLTTSIGLVAVVAMRPASVLLVKCVASESPHPECCSTMRLISSYVPHCTGASQDIRFLLPVLTLPSAYGRRRACFHQHTWQAVTNAARVMPAQGTRSAELAPALAPVILS